MLRLFLVLFVANLCLSLNARILNQRNGINLNGLSSTLIKSQQIEEGSTNQQGQFPADTSAEKNDDSHFRLFYKSNSPGRSVKHEMEHRFYKNPIRQQPKQDNFNQFFSMNSLQQQPSQFFSYSSNVPNQNDLTTDKSTMLNLHYHDNSDSQNNNFNLNQLLQQQQQQLLKLQLQQKQQQLEQQQQARKNQLMKIMLANYNSQKQAQLNAKQNNGVQYKIVNLKFRIEPQQGKFVGQGIVGTNNGAGNILNSKHFSLWPNELPALVRSILNTAQQQHHEGVPVFKKRQDTEAQMPINETQLEKRSEEDQLDDIQNIEPNSNRIKRSNEEEEGDETNNDNDNELQESFKSLQRRDHDNDDDSESNEEDDEEQSLNQRSYDQEDSGVASLTD